MLWENLREEEFDDAIERTGGLCVIPIGCLEKHGEHLPVGTDYYIARMVAEAAAEMEEVMIFPTSHWLGDVSGYRIRERFPAKDHGGIGLELNTVLRLLEELCDEIARNGFCKILLATSHGGNAWILPHFVRCQEKKEKPYATLIVNTYHDELMAPDPLLETIRSRREEFAMVTEEDIAVLESWRPTGYQGGHAEFIETSEIFSQYPHLVAHDKYEAQRGAGLPTHRSDYLFEMGVRTVRFGAAQYPNSYSGLPPYGASQSIGQAMIKINAEIMANIYKVIKSDDTCLKAVEMFR